MGASPGIKGKSKGSRTVSSDSPSGSRTSRTCKTTWDGRSPDRHQRTRRGVQEGTRRRDSLARAVIPRAMRTYPPRAAPGSIPSPALHGVLFGRVAYYLDPRSRYLADAGAILLFAVGEVSRSRVEVVGHPTEQDSVERE